VIGENPLYVSAIRLVMAQRLVRKLDDATKQQYQPDAGTIEKLNEIINSLPDGTEHPSLDNLQLFKAGSSPDNPYGYRGQIALREQFQMNGEIRSLLEHSKILSTSEIENAAIKSGMRTMLQDGILKAIAGETTMEEIYRVIG
ncbi:MAG TPA: hypothetical protein VFS31_19890, partial [Chitinophagaceae bacterium]|nr:hypothetical protein [Chitinophagaceae bacterium]